MTMNPPPDDDPQATLARDVAALQRDRAAAHARIAALEQDKQSRIPFIVRNPQRDARGIRQAWSGLGALVGILLSGAIREYLLFANLFDSLGVWGVLAVVLSPLVLVPLGVWCAMAPLELWFARRPEVWRTRLLRFLWVSSIVLVFAMVVVPSRMINGR